MAQDDFQGAAGWNSDDYNNSHHATAGDVQNAISLISRAGFEIEAMAYEHARRGRETLEEIFAGIESEGKLLDTPEHAFFFKKGDENLCLSWNYEDNTAEITLDKILPGEAIARVGNSQDFTLQEFAGYLRTRESPASGTTSPAPGS